MDIKRIFTAVDKDGNDMTELRFQRIEDTLFLIYMDSNYLSMPYNVEGFFLHEDFYTLKLEESLTNSYHELQNSIHTNNKFKPTFKNTDMGTISCNECNEGDNGFYFENGNGVLLCPNCASKANFNIIHNGNDNYYGLTNHAHVIEKDGRCYDNLYYDTITIRCGDCEERGFRHEMTQTVDGLVCEDCRDANYTLCAECDIWVRDEDIRANGCSHCMVSEASISTPEGQSESTPEGQSELILPYHSGEIEWSYSKMSTDDENPIFFGIEIEVEVREGISTITAAAEVKEAFNSINESMWLSHDSSIGGRGGFEIISNPTTKAYWDMHPNIAEKFYSFNKMVKAYHGTGCGMHIHISKTAIRNSDHMENLLNFMADGQEMIEIIAQRKPTNYWNHIPKGEVDELKKMQMSGDHYRGLAVKRETLEFRMFRGNLIPKRLNKNIEFVFAIVEYAKISADVFGFIDFVKKYKSDYPNLNQYLQEIFKLPGQQLDLVTELLGEEVEA